jgi:hypothetical protein
MFFCSYAQKCCTQTSQNDTEFCPIDILLTEEHKNILLLKVCESLRRLRGTNTLRKVLV